MNHIIGYTQNNVPVHIDLISSTAAKQVSKQPYLLTLTAEALRRITLDKLNAKVELNMGRDIGYDFIVETSATDNVFYAQLLREDIYTRFVKKGQPTPTAYLSLVLERAHDDAPYNLSGVWIGRQSPPRPGEEKEARNSKVYWEKHAFVFENQAIQLRTVTKSVPPEHSSVHV